MNQENKTKVYLVTSGIYSNYSVCCVCSSMDKAEHAKKFYASENDIEEYEIDALPEHPEGMFFYEVDMDRDGNVHSVETVNPFEEMYYEWYPSGDNKTVFFQMWATDEKHAVKIANEQRIMLVVSGQWTTDWKEWRDNKRKWDK